MWVVAAVVLLQLILGAAAWVYQVSYVGAPFLDEWVYSEGNAPVIYKNDRPGGYCLAHGDALRPGEILDPLGNRPLVCDGRRGWTVIQRGQKSDCLRDGRELPDGWSK